MVALSSGRLITGGPPISSYWGSAEYGGGADMRNISFRTGDASQRTLLGITKSTLSEDRMITSFVGPLGGSTTTSLILSMTMMSESEREVWRLVGILLQER